MSTATRVSLTEAIAQTSPRQFHSLTLAATIAYIEWEQDKGVPNPPPAGWIGGQVRNRLDDFGLDHLTGEDPTAEVGHAFYPDVTGKDSRDHYIETGAYLPVNQKEDA